MNKLIITDDIIELTNNENISVNTFDNKFFKEISLDILNDCILQIEYNIKENIKLNISININENIKFTLIDKKIGSNVKLKYNYSLNKNSSLTVNKINDVNNIKEYDLVNLNGENSNIKYVLKTVSTIDEHYDIVVNHNVKNCQSSITTNALNIEEGKTVINVTGYVPKGSINSDLEQNNRIINLTKNKCQINPNLLIDENIVNANHSAHISNFDDNDLFYIQSRGINKIDATALLIKGFLNSNLENDEQEYIDKIIKKYWR